MGSFIENNDTLQITREQGFPVELDLDKHLTSAPYTADEFTGRVFSFKDKPRVRNYNQPPVRTFLVENRNGKWVYWGRIQVFTTLQDLEHGTTSGTFRIIYIFTPEEMTKYAHRMLDGNPDTAYFRG